MKNKDYANICYVFSQSTLNLAINDWVDENKKITPKDHEQHLIVEAAIPWFLKHLNQNPSLFMFTHKDLVDGLETWKVDQEAEYPQKKKLIKSTCNEILNFFHSESVSNHKMRIEA